MAADTKRPRGRPPVANPKRGKHALQVSVSADLWAWLGEQAERLGHVKGGEPMRGKVAEVLLEQMRKGSR